MNIPPATLTPLVLGGASAETKGRAQRWNDVVKRMGAARRRLFAASAPEGAGAAIGAGRGRGFAAKRRNRFFREKARLDKELAKAEADIKRVDAKLANEKFVANAPEDIVEEEKEKREAAAARKTKILEAAGAGSRTSPSGPRRPHCRQDSPVKPRAERLPIVAIHQTLDGGVIFSDLSCIRERGCDPMFALAQGVPGNRLGSHRAHSCRHAGHCAAENAMSRPRRGIPGRTPPRGDAVRAQRILRKSIGVRAGR